MAPHRPFRCFAIMICDGLDERAVLLKRHLCPPGNEDRAVLEPNHLGLKRSQKLLHSFVTRNVENVGMEDGVYPGVPQQVSAAHQRVHLVDKLP